MIITDNAAYRLNNLLLNIQKSNGNDKLFDIWARVLNVKNKDRSIVLNRLGYVSTLPEEITNQIYQYKGIDNDLYLTWKTAVSRLLNCNNLDNNWASLKNSIPKENMVTLAFCSEKISETIKNEEIDDKKINQLIVDAENLLSEIESSVLNYKIKSFLIERLKGVISALSGCNIFSPNNFKTEFENAIGSIASQKDIVEEVAKTSFSDKFWKIMGRFAIITSIATTCLITAPEQLNKYIEAQTSRNQIVAEKSIVEREVTTEVNQATTEDVLDAEFTET